MSSDNVLKFSKLREIVIIATIRKLNFSLQKFYFFNLILASIFQLDYIANLDKHKQIKS